jgi:multidrug efflux system membrane fusion protein
MKEENSMKTAGKVWPGAIVAMFILAIAGCGSREDGSAGEAPITVRMAPVLVEERAPSVHTSGRLSSVLEAELSFKVGGIIESIGFDEGQAVTEGDVLARLKLDEIQAQAEQARSVYEKAERDYRRARDLYADSVITLERMQDAGTGVDLARAALEIAEFNLTYSAIRAPSDGKVLKRYAEADEVVAPGRPIFLFGSTAGGWVLRAAVNDREVIRLAIGDSAEVTFDAYRDRPFPAAVTEIAGAADPMSGGYEIELAVGPEGQRLVSGFVGEVEIHPSMRGRYSVIPIEALVEADGGKGVVYTVDPATKRARAVHVTVGHIVGSRVAVTGGLEDVMWVVTDGAPYLADSSLVSISK